MEREVNATVYEIAYAEAVRALSEQHAVIDSFRTRAGLLLSSAAVTTSFLAAQALRSDRTSAFAWLALLTFAAVALLALATLQPRRWEVSAHPNEMTAYLAAKHKASPGELYEVLTLRLRRAHTENRDVLGYLAILLQVASSLLATEVVFWILAIAAAA